MHPYYVLTMRKGTSAPAPSVPADFNVYVETKPRRTTTQATAYFSMNSDGSCSGSTPFSPGSWITPVGGSYGSSYWVIVNVEAGTLSSGTAGSRVQIGTGKTWSVTTSGTYELRAAEVEGTIEVWTAATGGTMVASGTFYLLARVDNT